MIEILEPATDVVAQVTENPALAILNEEKFEAFYEKLKAEAAKVSGDVSTNKARDEVRSMAFKIAKTRTAIDKARLGLTEEWRTKTAQANTAGKAIKERLEALEESVRKPLTDWEQAEAERVKAHTDLMTAITKAEFVGIEDTAESVAERIEWLDGLLIDPDVHLEKLDFVQGAKDAAIEKLTVQHMRLVREESERAELERLRQQEAARIAELEAERARAEAEKAEQERLERLRQQAVEETKRAAEQARIDQERKHQAELEAERAKVAKAEADRLAEEQRVAAEAARVERERVAREQDREHRAKIMGAAKAALMELDIPEDKAREIVLAIAAGNIPAVSIRF
jgi:colicin import membrane protein